jgi:hypothetical protein
MLIFFEFCVAVLEDNTEVPAYAHAKSKMWFAEELRYG